MDFVTGMLTAQRYVRESDSMQKEFIRTFMNNNLSASKKDIQATESILSAWAERHPEQTDTKEGKTVKTKVEELLNIVIGEVFEVKGYGSVLLKLDVDCSLLHKSTSKAAVTWAKTEPHVLPMLINNPSLIIRRPAYIPEQVKTMKWLRDGGFRWVAKDKDGLLYAYDARPAKGTTAWSCMDEKGYVKALMLDCLSPLIPDWTVPLDLLAALRDAGEGKA